MLESGVGHYSSEAKGSTIWLGQKCGNARNLPPTLAPIHSSMIMGQES